MTKTLARTILPTVLALVSSLLFAGVALAQEAGDDGGDIGFQANEFDTQLSYDFFQDEEQEHSILFYAVGEDADCELADDALIVVNDDGTIENGPEGCQAVDTEGPQGQVNHGSVVSSFVHDLKAQLESGELEYEGPLGWLVRDIARSQLGKHEQQAKAGGDDVEALELEEDGERGGPPDWVIEKKAQKQAEKGNRGGRP